MGLLDLFFGGCKIAQAVTPFPLVPEALRKNKTYEMFLLILFVQ